MLYKAILIYLKHNIFYLLYLFIFSGGCGRMVLGNTVQNNKTMLYVIGISILSLQI